jgi:metallo-beta-lactamase family protein
MDVTVKFLGAAQSVTGSKFLLEIDHYTLMVDCGLFQGLKELRLRNWDDLPIDPKSIDAIILTHAHIDHSGYLPRLVKNGYDGPIYCTEATQGLLEIMLLDAAKLQEEEAVYAKHKGYSKHENPEPLFDTSNAELALSKLQSFPYNTEISLNEKIDFMFYNAGHILGSAILELKVQGDNQKKTMLFSGDLGRYNQPLLENPHAVKQADILFVESTYGARINVEKDIDIEEVFTDKINKALGHGGCLLIPSFSVGRTQIILYYLQKLQSENKIPSIPIYVDSPMAISTTDLYKRYPDYHTLSNDDFEGPGLFDYPTIKYYRSQQASMSINTVTENAIIISASGMCTGGRILHHLFHRLGNKNDTLLFVGFQAIGTRGRRILDGEPTIRIFGTDVTIKCHLDKLNGLSAHADQDELHQWLDNFQEAPKKTFVIHGEIENSLELAHYMRMDKKWDNVYIPNYLESFELFQGI